MAAVKVNDKVYVKHLDEFGTVQSVRGNHVEIKLDSGKVVTLFNILIEVVEKIPGIIGWVKGVWKRIKGIF